MDKVPQIKLLRSNIEKLEKLLDDLIDNVDSKINIYELLHLSSFVIGRYSSLIEESLSDGINAIIYDECNFFSSIITFIFFNPFF